MRYPVVRYSRTDDELTLMLHGFDGTVRSVSFADRDGVEVALLVGRAEPDFSAVLRNFLPRGALHVAPAAVPDADELASMARLCGDGDDEEDPLAIVRVRFSLELAASRGAPIDASMDAEARAAMPVEAERYERLADMIAKRRLGDERARHGR